MIAAVMQAEVARLLAERGIELHPSAIAKIEDRDTDRPWMIRLDEAGAIADIFNMKIDEILSPLDAVKRLLFDCAYWLNQLHGEAE